MEGGETIRILAGILAGLPFYFLPSIIAFIRKKRQKNAIFLLNIFLGWTCIGWIIAIIWAVMVDAPAVENRT